MDFNIVKMYKDKEVNKNVKNISLSMCDVRVFLTFTVVWHNIDLKSLPKEWFVL
jgi:hypothetical protein